MDQSGIDPDAFNAFEAAGWQARADAYDAFFAGVTSRVVDPLLDAAEVTAGTRVLDVATGPGYAASRAAARGAVTSAVDVAPAMVELLRNREPGIDVEQGDAEQLPFPAATFDAVLCNFGVLHMGRPERAVAEFARVTAPGGRVAMTVWDQPERARLIGVLVDAMAEAGATAPADMPQGPPFFRFSDEGAFTALAMDAGYVDVAVHTLAFRAHVPSAHTLWHGLLGGTVRTGPVVLAQPPERRAAVRAAFDRLVEAFANPDGGLDVPVSVKLATARTPAG
jgi:ubiquinone/menaquinone biosynthesis C-methylase UbiE